MKLRVAILPEHFNWGGGFDFLRHILNGLSSVASKYGFEICFAVQKELFESKSYQSFLDYANQTYVNEILVFHYSSCQVDLAHALREHHVDIVLPVNSDLGASFPIPWVGYIPDFQHKYLYDNFTEHECFERETAFSARLRDCKTLLVNSIAVKDDVLKFYPWIESERVFSLPYSPHPMSEWLIPTENRCWQEKYGIGERYFMLCNQFWIHKDHKTAFLAFANLSDNDIQLVCSGSMEDYRFPQYIPELIQMLDGLNIRHKVIFLGHIPKLEQIMLLRGALALIQPTLFEGGPGGGAVYDAVSLSVPVILSNIKVNQEVDADNVDFFQAGDVDDLVRTMSKRLMPTPRLNAEELLLIGSQNREALGEKLYCIIQKTLERYRGR